VLVKVINFNKLEISSDEIDIAKSNQVRLLGKIVTDFRGDADVISFRISVPREGNNSPLYFCRAQGELINEMKSKLKKGDIILLEGFLQTKKLLKKEEHSYEFLQLSVKLLLFLIMIRLAILILLVN